MCISLYLYLFGREASSPCGQAAAVATVQLFSTRALWRWRLVRANPCVPHSPQVPPVRLSSWPQNSSAARWNICFELQTELFPRSGGETLPKVGS